MSGGSVTTPHEVDGMASAVAIALGDEHSCALLDGGSVYCWGDKGNDQLAGGTGDSLLPQQVVGIGDGVAISAGGDTTCVQHATGRYTCCGEGDSGELGIGESIPSSAPVRAIWH